MIMKELEVVNRIWLFLAVSDQSLIGLRNSSFIKVGEMGKINMENFSQSVTISTKFAFVFSNGVF